MAEHTETNITSSTDPKMAVLMWGISQSISKLSHVAPPVELTNDDFKAYSKVKIDDYYFNRENMPRNFKFKEYMPLVFCNLRRKFNIDEKLFLRSFVTHPETKQQTGHSGSKFFLTDDNKFWVKTMVSEEVEVMHNIMPAYYQYISESKIEETLLPHYLAMYRTTVDAKENYYMVLRNVFSPAKKVHKKYDLKGSKIDREAKDSDEVDGAPTFKDNDFTKDNVKLHISESAQLVVLETIKKDVDFLSRINVMDYSLLIGIHDTVDVVVSDQGLGNAHTEEISELPLELQPTSNTRQINDGVYDPELFAIPSYGGSNLKTYYIGIIDVLSYYGATKKAAHVAKTVRHGSEAEISTVNPQVYAKRFVEFIETIFE